jgi:hypothetical protein
MVIGIEIFRRYFRDFPDNYILIGGVPDSIADDMKEFMEVIKSEPPDYKAIGKNAGISAINGADIIEQLEQKFSL